MSVCVHNLCMLEYRKAESVCSPKLEVFLCSAWTTCTGVNVETINAHFKVSILCSCMTFVYTSILPNDVTIHFSIFHYSHQKPKRQRKQKLSSLPKLKLKRTLQVMIPIQKVKATKRKLSKNQRRPRQKL